MLDPGTDGMEDIQASLDSEERVSTSPLWQLRGIGKDLFKEPGGWEALIREERDQFSIGPLRHLTHRDVQG